MGLINFSQVPLKKRLIIALFIFTFVVYGFSLPFSIVGSPHFSPGNDFSNHAHLMYRFAESFKSGQLIPRTIVTPTIFADSTVPTSDIPTFQYYGFFEGVIALPFHLLGTSYTNAAVLSSILIRFLGSLVLFETCLLLDASLLTAFLSSISLLISPYLLATFYGRGALAETFAQSLLTLIPYGYALAHHGQARKAIFVFALAFFCLPLCHNIFFLFGALLLAFLTIFSFQFKVILSAAIGSCLGILLSAWQWLPAQNTIKDIVIFGPLNSWKIGAYVETHTASISGAIGFPKPYLPEGYTQPFPIYFTIGWWVFPFILLSITAIIRKGKRRLAFSFFITSILFVALSFQPYNDYIFRHYMPVLFEVVQDTSRLISFVSLLGAICLALVLPKLNYRFFTILFISMLISQVPVFICYINLASKQSWTNEEIKGAPMNYYYSNPAYSYSYIQLKKSDGLLNVNNQFYIPPDSTYRFFVRLNGAVIPFDAHLKIAVASLRQDPLSLKYTISSIASHPVNIHSNFSTTIEVPITSPSGWYKIVLLPINNKENIDQSHIVPLQIDIMPNNLANFIFPENLENPKMIFGYTRKYRVKQAEISHFQPDKEGYYTVQLPIAYSNLFSVKQKNNDLLKFADFNHRMLVRTKDLNTPIKIQITLDLKSFTLTMMGIIGLLLLTLKKARPNEDYPNAL